MFYGLTPLGIVHTVISLVAVAAGLVALVRYKEIALATRAGRIYVVATALTCLTGFGIFQHGGFGPPHVLGIVTLVVLATAMAAERGKVFGKLSAYVAVVCYSLTFFFHMIPGVTETATRLPLGAPLVADRDASPGLRGTIGALFIVFLIGATVQVLRLRATRQRDALDGLRMQG
ncbi:hypothetical protein QTH90_19200 [Variovorax sp. J2P1-59]|uniref:hypothetical protein n=1 Tax=Variovorax flavidus TaxID=3053501 RepID=UPI0025763B46|nr:hypothetical protein [Variovorax sp. J2P1-59]MDM0076545.1 hypothetical protein [Variovorax sp. J2P1-59]